LRNFFLCIEHVQSFKLLDCIIRIRYPIIRSTINNKPLYLNTTLGKLLVSLSLIISCIMYLQSGFRNTFGSIAALRNLNVWKRWAIFSSKNIATLKGHPHSLYILSSIICGNIKRRRILVIIGVVQILLAHVFIAQAIDILDSNYFTSYMQCWVYFIYIICLITSQYCLYLKIIDERLLSTATQAACKNVKDAITRGSMIDANGNVTIDKDSNGGIGSGSGGGKYTIGGRHLLLRMVGEENESSTDTSQIESESESESQAGKNKEVSKKSTQGKGKDKDYLVRNLFNDKGKLALQTLAAHSLLHNCANEKTLTTPAAAMATAAAAAKGGVRGVAEGDDVNRMLFCGLWETNDQDPISASADNSNSTTPTYPERISLNHVMKCEYSSKEVDRAQLAVTHCMHDCEVTALQLGQEQREREREIREQQQHHQSTDVDTDTDADTDTDVGPLSRLGPLLMQITNLYRKFMLRSSMLLFLAGVAVLGTSYCIFVMCVIGEKHEVLKTCNSTDIGSSGSEGLNDVCTYDSIRVPSAPWAFPGKWGLAFADLVLCVEATIRLIRAYRCSNHVTEAQRCM